MKVFDYIDFNEFFEDKIKFDITRPKIKKELCLEEVYLDLLTEMARDIVPGSSSRSAIRLDDDDIMYLYQFLPTDWSKALWWRYGPGLVSYARQRHQNIEEEADDEKDSHFHGVDEKGIPMQNEAPKSIMFNANVLLGKGKEGKRELRKDPSLGDHQGKAQLNWMEPKDGYKDHHNLSTDGEGLSGERKYTGINFGWNKLYHKLNLGYKFGMQKVNDKDWHRTGELPNLAGYTPMKFAGVNNQLNKYFKAMGISNHHPDGQPDDSGNPQSNYQDILKNHQQNMGKLRGRTAEDVAASYTTNDHENPHEIVPLTHGTNLDGQWNKRVPAASVGRDGADAQHAHEGEAYRDHMYHLMSGVRANGEQSGGLPNMGTREYNHANDHVVQPYYLGSTKPGKYSSYNAYEVFGLHKSMKYKEWETEKYFPQEFHDKVWQKMKDTAEGTGKNKKNKSQEEEDFSNLNLKSIVNTSKAFDLTEPNDVTKMEDFKLKLKNHEWNWIPLNELKPEEKQALRGKAQQKARLSQQQNNPHIEEGEIKEDNQGNFYKRVRDKFVTDVTSNHQTVEGMPKWKYVFLMRYLDRFEREKSSALTHNQHLAVTSAYKSISADDINDTVSSHPELGMAQASLKHKRSKQTDKMREVRHREDTVGGTSGKRKQDYNEKEISLAGNYKNYKAPTDPNTGKPKLPEASATDIMVGGTMHEFGGPGGNIEEKNKMTVDKNGNKIKGGKWQKIPPQEIFVPLLHRGQVLPSEKQLGKGINVGSFGHSQSSEVETNHFGKNDKFPVPKSIARRYGFSEEDTVAEEIKDLSIKEKNDTIKPIEVDNLKKYRNIMKGIDPNDPNKALCFVNRTDYFWKAAEDGKSPSSDFFSKDDANHNNVMRNTDHNHEHMNNAKEDVKDKDGILWYDPTNGIDGGPQPRSSTTIPVLRSVFEGVKAVLKKFRENEDTKFLYSAMAETIGEWWDAGEAVLKANVGHPQFFKNNEYEDRLKSDESEMPTDDKGKIDPQALRRSELKAEHTSNTGFLYRKMRVINRIRSLSQKKFGDNVSNRRNRQGNIEGLTQTAEGSNLNITNNNYNHLKDQEQVSKKRGKNKHFTGGSLERLYKELLSAKEESRNTLEIKEGSHMANLESKVRSANLALMALYAIESKKVPRAREIAQYQKDDPENGKLAIKNPVSKEIASSKEFGNSKEYKEAHLTQFRLAWKWATENAGKDWNERLQKTKEFRGEELWSGATSVVNDENFVKSLANTDLVEELWERSFEYDDKASFDIIKADFDESDLEKDDDYRRFMDTIEGVIPKGLFDFENFNKTIEIFKDDLIGGNKPPEQVKTRVKVLYDFLLSSMNSYNRPADWTQELENKLDENALAFAKMLDNSEDEDIWNISTNFYDQYRIRKTDIKKPPTINRSIAKNINSLASSVTDEGRTTREKEYNEKIKELPKNKEGKYSETNALKKEKYEDAKSKYIGAWEEFSVHMTKFNFAPNSSIIMKEKLDKMVKDDKDHKDDIIRGFEDAVLDQTVSHLNDEHNYKNNAKNLKSFMGFLFNHGTSLEDHFRKNVKSEIESALRRHKEGQKIHNNRRGAA